MPNRKACIAFSPLLWVTTLFFAIATTPFKSLAAITMTGSSSSPMSTPLDHGVDVPPPPPPLPQRWLVLDFDGTCTEVDTTPLLPKLASLISNDTDAQRHARQSAFDALEREYFALYSAAKESVFRDIDNDNNHNDNSSSNSNIHNKDGGGTSSDNEESDGNNGDRRRRMLNLDEALDVLDEPSTLVTRKVSASRCLAGLHIAAAAPARRNDDNHNDNNGDMAHNDCNDDIGDDNDPSRSPCQIADLLDTHSDIAAATKLRSGCIPTVVHAHRSGWKLGILSINWCPALIDAALLRPLCRHWKQENTAVEGGGEVGGGEGGGSALPPSADVWSNAIDVDGAVTLHVPGASAKKARIAALRKRQREHHHHPSSSLVVYIGDSSTDLSGLLEADVGVLLGDSSTTAAIAERWGIRLVPVAQRRRCSKGRNADDVATVWTVRGWDEIEKLLTDLMHDDCEDF